MARCLAAVVAALACLAAPAPATARRPPDPPALHEIGMKPWGQIRDNVVERPPTAGAAQSSNVYTTDDGHRVRVIVSPSYQPSPDADREYVSFVSGLLHGPELDGLTLVVAPAREIAALCEDPASLACYEANREIIYIPGEEFGPEGPSLASVLAHEYGHHVARNRTNAPWPAFHWGPKFWSTHMDVCGRAAAGDANPGDEGARYSFNPAEAWAETFVVLNGGPWGGIVDASFEPDAAALAQARRDVLDPWPGNGFRARKPLLRRRGRWTTSFAPLDGNIIVYLTPPPHTRYEVTLRAGADGRLLARTRSGRRGRAIAHTACGVETAVVEVRALAGGGVFRIGVSRP